MLTNPMLVMLKKLKLSLKRLKIKSLRKTKKHQFPLVFALIIQCVIVLLKLIIFKGKIFELFCLKVKVKVSALKLKLKLKFIFTPKYFQVLRQKNSRFFYLENIKVRPHDDFSTYWLHWCVCECTKSRSVEWRCFFPEHLI